MPLTPGSGWETIGVNSRDSFFTLAKRKEKKG